MIIVTLTAVPLDISSILNDDRVGAVLHVGQPSVQTLGIGDIIFGAASLVVTNWPEHLQQWRLVWLVVNLPQRPVPSFGVCVLWV